MDINTLKAEVKDELTRDILPFWADRMMDPRGGFYGRMDGKGNICKDEQKGLILNARILWTFSSAYRVLGNEAYLQTATRAKREIIDRFIDKEYGGVYWSVDADGAPLDTKKQLYALGFALYGLSEYARATDDVEAKRWTGKLFTDIETHFYDETNNGYVEALTRDWQPIADMRLSEKDQNDSKTMNSHLHILEPYTNMYRVLPSGLLSRKIENLINIFTDKILCPDGHLGLFFNEKWNPNSKTQSFGHDIEASWLLWEAACVLDNDDLKAKLKPICMHIADAAAEGLNADSSLRYEALPANNDLHWWVQAENVAGNMNAYKLSGNILYLDRAFKCWSFIKTHLICPDGEWYWSVDSAGNPNTADDRAGFWKCPYHNGRMCMEILEKYD